MTPSLSMMKVGIVRFKQTYEKGIPDAAEILAEVERLG